MLNKLTRRLLALLALLGLVALANASGASATDPWADRTQVTRTSFMAHINSTDSNVVLKITPSAATGYGQMNLQPGYGGSNYFYHPYRHLYDYTNTAAAQRQPAGTSGGPVRTSSGFCWPWDDGGFSGDACWNDPTSWDWGALIHSGPGSGDMTNSRLNSCLAGQLGGSFAVVGKTMIARMIGVLGQAKFTPEGFVFAIAGGCIMKLLW